MAGAGARRFSALTHASGAGQSRQRGMGVRKPKPDDSRRGARFRLAHT
jgi:hypothetical protein